MSEITEQDKEFVKAITLARVKDATTLDLLRSRALFFWTEDSLSARIFANLLEDKLNNKEMFGLRQEGAIFQQYQNLIVEIRARVVDVLSLEEQQTLLREHVLDALRYNPNFYDDLMSSFDVYDEDFAHEEAEKLLTTLENNQEILGTQQLNLSDESRPVAPQIKYWIEDFNKFAGGLQVSSEKISEYLRENENVRKLNGAERETLFAILKIVNNLKKPQLISGGIAAAGESSERVAELEEVLSKRTISQAAPGAPLASAAPANDILEPTPEEAQGRPQPTGPEASPLAGQPSAAIPKPPAPTAPSSTQTASLAEQGQGIAAPIPSDLIKPKRGFFGRRQQEGSNLQIKDSPAVAAAAQRAAATRPEPQTQPAASQPTLENSLQTVAEEYLQAYPQGGAEYIRQLHMATQARLQKEATAKAVLANNWKQSPLYQKYLQIGQASMQSGKPIQDVLQESGSQLTLPEFEQITSLSKTLS